MPNDPAGNEHLENESLAIRNEYIEKRTINALIFNRDALISRWYITTLQAIVMNRILFFIIINISLLQFSCNSNKELISNADKFDHVLVGYMKKRAFYVMDQAASGKIELVQELKGSARTSTMYNTPCPINRQGEHVSILESPSELKDFVCIRYGIGNIGRYKPQSFMLTRNNPDNDCESEVLLFYNEEIVDTFSRIGDARLNCYHLTLFSNTRVDNEEFQRTKQRLLKKLN